MNAAQTATPRRAIDAIRRRLEKLELEHLRTHAAELADKVERLQTKLEYAESAAESWRDDYFQLTEQLLPEGSSIGLSVDGSLHVMKPDSCNTHDDLVAAAKAAEAILTKQKWLEGSTDPEAIALTKLRAALTKAGAA